MLVARTSKKKSLFNRRLKRLWDVFALGRQAMADASSDVPRYHHQADTPTDATRAVNRAETRGV